MKTFREHLKEEVMPSVFVKDGSIDIEKPEVRANINAILASITSRGCVTPYVVLNKISKALAQFHIILPKRTYMEGNHGVEVYDMKQFGDRMGMNDQGEFIHEVPNKYYLFLHYHLVGPYYMVRARVVDKAQLDKELDAAEAMISEDAQDQQLKAKMRAPKEDQHTALGDCDCSQGDSPSTKKAVDVSMRRSDKKLSADKLNEKLTKGMKVSDVISDFVHSDDPKFKGKSKKERQKMALGAYYSMHPEKSRKE